MEKGFKQFIIRAVIFLALLLLIFPAIRQSFIPDDNLYDRVNIVYYTERISLIAGLSLIIFILMKKESLSKLKIYPYEKTERKYSLLFALLAIALFFFMFSTETADFDSLMNANVVHVHGNHADLGNGWILGESITVDNDQNLMYANVSKEILIDKNYHTIRWCGSRQGSNFFAEMRVNGNVYDITSQYRSLEDKKISWLELNISEEHIKDGLNKIELNATGSWKSGVMICSQWVYNDNRTMSPGSESLLLYAVSGYNPKFKAVQDFRFLAKLAAIIFLFLACFGMHASRELIIKKELLLSTVSAYIIYFFAFAIQQYWLFFAGTGAFVSYKILGIFSPAVFDAADITLGIPPFIVRVNQPCSGIEGLGFFAIMSMLIIAIDWKKVNKAKALLLLPIGLLGMFLTNVLRITLIILIGTYVDADFALSTFHTNVGWALFIIYFLVFWYFAYGWITEKGKK